MMLQALPIASALFFGGADAFWRMSCAPIMNGRLDPIVSSGKVSTHSHTVVGASNFGVNSTFNSLSTSQCTSCEIQDDKSAYWTPNLYYQYANGSFVDVPHGGAVVYYLGRGKAQGNLQPFPPGFQMVSGNALARSYDNTTMTWGNATYPGRPIADRVSFACLDTQPMAEQPYMFRTQCVNGMRAQLHFQSCWDGVNLYKSDNSHVAYLSQIDDGVCPPTHPVPFVHLFMEVNYAVGQINTADGGKFVFSTGDTTGYGFHGDFQNGWNISVLTKAISGQNSCASIVGSQGNIADCPVLVKSQISNYPWQCPEKPNQVNETVLGILSHLPGCINITSGPAAAQAYDQQCPASIPTPYITSTVDSTPIATKYPVPHQPYGRPNWEYVGCSNDSAATRALRGAFTYLNTTSNVESCQDYCTWQGYKYAGLEYGTQCLCDNNLSPLTPPVFGQTGCNYRCIGDNTENCGGQSRIDIYNNTKMVPLPQPTYVAVNGKYVHKGCYTEATSGRALSNASTSSNTMTVDACTKFCLGKGFKWAGVEYGRECYCGSILNAGATPTALSQCTMICSGNSGQKQQYCGSGSRLNIYYSSTL